jgi:hypothetical protein
MTVFAGHNGVVQLRRNTQNAKLSTNLQPDDINIALNRFSFDGAEDELLTGDTVTISTEDTRGLLFLPTSFWSWTTTAVPLNKATFFVNVNAVGGIRVFRGFNDAVNNVRANEVSLASFSGAPLLVSLSVTSTNFYTVGKVTGYTLNTEREAVETTVLSDKFKQQYSAGLISGNGSIDALFSCDAADLEETPLLMLQIIQRIETGSAFESSLYLTTKSAYGSSLDVWYQFKAVVTRSGVEVSADGIITCAIDFLTTGEVKLQVGSAPGSALQQEDGSKLNLGEYTLGALLQKVED